MLRLQSHPYSDHLLSLRYRFLATEAYQQGKLTEGQLARLLRVDRVEARQMVQELTYQPYVSEEGTVAGLTVDFAGAHAKTGYGGTE